MPYRMEVFLCICIHEQLVKVICDPAAILDGTDHVPHSLPGRLCSLLCIHLQQVILHSVLDHQHNHVSICPGEKLQDCRLQLCHVPAI